MAEPGVAPGKGKARGRGRLTADLESQSLKAHNCDPRRVRTDLTVDLESLILCETHRLCTTCRHTFYTRDDKSLYCRPVVAVSTGQLVPNAVFYIVKLVNKFANVDQMSILPNVYRQRSALMKVRPTLFVSYHTR